MRNWFPTVKGENVEYQVGGGEEGLFLCWGGIYKQTFGRRYYIDEYIEYLGYFNSFYNNSNMFHLYNWEREKEEKLTIKLINNSKMQRQLLGHFEIVSFGFLCIFIEIA